MKLDAIPVGMSVGVPPCAPFTQEQFDAWYDRTHTCYLLCVDDLELPATIQRDEGGGWRDVVIVTSLESTLILPVGKVLGRFVCDYAVSEGIKPRYQVAL